MEAGRIIKLLRVAEQVPQEQLAEDLGVTRAYLSQVENGREPSLAFLKNVSERFSVPLPLLVISDHDANCEITSALRSLVEKLLLAKINLWSTSIAKDSQN